MINRVLHNIYYFLERYLGVSEDAEYIQVMPKFVIYRTLYYPACDYSKFLCRISNRKTLSEELIEELKADGYLIDYVRDR